MNKQHFRFSLQGDDIGVSAISPQRFFAVTLYIDDIHAGTFYGQKQLRVNKRRFLSGKHMLTAVGYYVENGRWTAVSDIYTFTNPDILLPRDIGWAVGYRAGDILIASDNLAAIPPGYVGHASLVVSANDMIEVIGPQIPIIRQNPIDFFLRYHRQYAHYRPKSAEMGERAAAYARYLLNQYLANLGNGINKPVFSYQDDHQLSNPWSLIYCSKMIWNCYYHGAGYAFPNDHYLFSPEDLSTVLAHDDNFELIYRTPDFQFYLDT